MKMPPLVFRVGFFAVVAIVAVLVATAIIEDGKKLPVFKPIDLNPDLVDESIHPRKPHHVGSFELTDQRSRTITDKDLEGKIYLTDFFFTTCQGICLDMSRNMARIQDAFQNEESFMMLSHSVTPEEDTPEVLMEYGKRYGADNDQWLLLTGDRKHIYELARKAYFAATTEGDGGLNDLVHTENFVLVDKEKRIRGYYDGTDDEDVDRAIDDIKRLLKEYQAS